MQFLEFNITVSAQNVRNFCRNLFADCEIRINNIKIIVFFPHPSRHL